MMLWYGVAGDAEMALEEATRVEDTVRCGAEDFAVDPVLRLTTQHPPPTILERPHYSHPIVLASLPYYHGERLKRLCKAVSPLFFLGGCSRSFCLQSAVS